MRTLIELTFHGINDPLFKNIFMKKIFACILICITSVAYAQKPKQGVVMKMTISQERWDQLSKDYIQLQKQMEELKTQQKKIETILQELMSHDQKLRSFTADLQNWEKQIDSTGASTQTQLLQATKQMQQTQSSFNTQYLQLQSHIQNENRQYTAVSNIMKTKHETVKNTISNIR